MLITKIFVWEIKINFANIDTIDNYDTIYHRHLNQGNQEWCNYNSKSIKKQIESALLPIKNKDREGVIN